MKLKSVMSTLSAANLSRKRSRTGSVDLHKNTDGIKAAATVVAPVPRRQGTIGENASKRTGDDPICQSDMSDSSFSHFDSACSLSSVSNKVIDSASSKTSVCDPARASLASSATVDVAAVKNTAAATPVHLSEEDNTILNLVKSILSSWKHSSDHLNEGIIRTILRRVRPVLMSQPMLLRLSAPLNICGDIHGQITDLVEIFKAGGMPPDTSYLFLGDYVDRGKYGTEVITVLLGLKVLYPDQIHILRGNHETDSICRIYGFFEEIKRRFHVRLFKEFTDVFNCLPIAALIDEVALCMHGGLSPQLRNLRQIEKITRPLVVADEGLACDLLWSDPEETSVGWQPNDRGVSYTFGDDVVRRMCNALNIDTIFRAHQVVDNGYAFFAGRRLVTIFSASNYCGEFTNSGAMMIMDAECRCSFQIFKPQYN